MQTDNALALLEGIRDGSVALKDIGQLGRADIDAIARVGAAALAGHRYDVARTVFQGLTALDPREAQHLLHLGAVEQAAGRVPEAVTALTEFIDADLNKSHADVARALLMRAELIAGSDKSGAAADVTAARVLASTSGEARAVLEREYGMKLGNSNGTGAGGAA